MLLTRCYEICAFPNDRKLLQNSVPRREKAPDMFLPKNVIFKKHFYTCLVIFIVFISRLAVWILFQRRQPKGSRRLWPRCMCARQRTARQRASAIRQAASFEIALSIASLM